MRARGWTKRIGLLGLLGIALGTTLGLGGCVYVPPGPYNQGYYAPAPVVVAPPPVVIAPRPYFHGHYGWGYRRW